MKTILNVLKWLIGLVFGTSSWIDNDNPCRDCDEEIYLDKNESDPHWIMGDAPLVKYELILKHSPDSYCSILYIGETKNIEMTMVDGLQYDLEMSSRIFTKINNRLEKHNEIELPKELFEEWKAHIIDHLGEQAF